MRTTRPLPPSCCAANSFTSRSDARTFSWRNASSCSAVELAESSAAAAGVVDDEDVERAERVACCRDDAGRRIGLGEVRLDVPDAELVATRSVPSGSAYSCSTSCAVQPWTKTLAPASWSRRAIANPIPARRLTPVTSAFFPDSSIASRPGASLGRPVE